MRGFRMQVIETDRLTLRPLAVDDAPFVLELLTDPDWHRFIGDRRVRTVEGAQKYIAEGPLASYARFGFGLLAVERNEDGAPVGICGLIKRDALDEIDLGYALLPRYRGRGYAREAARAVVHHGRSTHQLRRIVAITSPDNVRSIRLLESLGFDYERMVKLPGDGEETLLFAETGDASGNAR